MAHILMLLNQFSPRGAPADPPRQLADAFVAEGHSVTAIVIPWQQAQDGIERYDEHECLRVLRVPPLEVRWLGRIGGWLFRWILSSRRAVRHAATFVGAGPVDLIYTTSPALPMGSLLGWALRTFREARSYLYIVDFFPFHQRAIGLVPRGPLFAIARNRENALVRRFDILGCMSPRNMEFLRAYYPLRREQEVKLLPLSTGILAEPRIDRAEIRARYGLPADKPIAIFGGQISEGRGIEEIVEAARRARASASDIHFVLAGGGRLIGLVEAYVANGGQNLSLIPGLPRDVYLDLAAACDIGLVVTVPIANIPTFPSKTLDYLQAGLPVVAAVEPDTDFRPFVEEHGFGLVVPAGDPAALLAALTTLARDSRLRHDMAVAGRRTLLEVFDVKQAAKRILGAAMLDNGPA